jgi:predicted ATPase
LEQSLAVYDSQKYRAHAFLYGQDPGVTCLANIALILWLLGYPGQALRKVHEALTLARELSHSPSLAFALAFAACVHQCRHEGPATQEWAESMLTLAIEQGFVLFEAWGKYMRGWAVVEQGQGDGGITQIHQGIAIYRATGAELAKPYQLVLLAEAYGKVGQIKEGLRVVAEGLAALDKAGERLWEAELYRLKGQLTLQFEIQSLKSKVEEEAEGCFRKAIEIAHQQQAKSLELRAVMSLVRLRQRQAQEHATRSTQHDSRSTQHDSRVRLAESHRMLAAIYHWFTEGFDTKDLQEAKALLAELSD